MLAVTSYVVKATDLARLHHDRKALEPLLAYSHVVTAFREMFDREKPITATNAVRVVFSFTLHRAICAFGTARIDFALAVSDTAPAPNDATTAAASAPQELETMKKRIDELEAQLKATQGKQTGATAKPPVEVASNVIPQTKAPPTPTLPPEQNAPAGPVDNFTPFGVGVERSESIPDEEVQARVFAG
jgi:hypothetical protein